jgi:TDG/mug DNA glycosylase family protein
MRSTKKDTVIATSILNIKHPEHIFLHIPHVPYTGITHENGKKINSGWNMPHEGSPANYRGIACSAHSWQFSRYAILKKKEYYGNLQNHFWKIMGSLFSIESDLSYDMKISLLGGYRIALWDVIHSCCREGSADTRIRDPVFNDIAGFLKSHPTIRFIVLNGNSAGQYYHRMKITGSVHSEVLPSTSPANTRYSLSEKTRKWETFRLQAIPG